MAFAAKSREAQTYPISVLLQLAPAATRYKYVANHEVQLSETTFTTITLQNATNINSIEKKFQSRCERVIHALGTCQSSLYYETDNKFSEENTTEQKGLVFIPFPLASEV
jgi:hypothetical protein